MNKWLWTALTIVLAVGVAGLAYLYLDMGVTLTHHEEALRVANRRSEILAGLLTSISEGIDMETLVSALETEFPDEVVEVDGNEVFVAGTTFTFSGGRMSVRF